MTDTAIRVERMRRKMLITFIVTVRAFNTKMVEIMDDEKDKENL